MFASRISFDRLWKLASLDNRHRLTDASTPVASERGNAEELYQNPSKRFDALLLHSDEVLLNAERFDLQDCVRILAAHCAQYQSKFGEIPLSETVHLLTSGGLNDEQAGLVANGLDLIVSVIAVLEDEQTEP